MASSDPVHVPFSTIGFQLANAWMCQHTIDNTLGCCSVGASNGNNSQAAHDASLSERSYAWMSSTTTCFATNIFEFVTKSSFEFPVTAEELDIANEMQIRCFNNVNAWDTTMLDDVNLMK